MLKLLNDVWGSRYGYLEEFTRFNLKAFIKAIYVQFDSAFSNHLLHSRQLFFPSARQLWHWN